jgi:hypothetical protein
VFRQGNKMNVRLYDLTGMVGLGVPRECLLDTDVDVVLTVGRTPQGYSLRAIYMETLARNCRGRAERSSEDAASRDIEATRNGLGRPDFGRRTLKCPIACQRPAHLRAPSMLKEKSS